MAHRSVLIEVLKALAIALSIVVLVSNLFFSGAGCAIFHRYPAYRGRVLELGTNQPIEGAGVLSVYRVTRVGIGDSEDAFLGYRAVLTDKDGRFEIPWSLFWNYWVVGWFDDHVRITIYKKGYGNFPGSFEEDRPRHGVTEPKLPPGAWVPPKKEVTFWLPKLETEEEIREHDRLFPDTLPGNAVLPRGMTWQEFDKLYRGF